MDRDLAGHIRSVLEFYEAIGVERIAVRLPEKKRAEKVVPVSPVRIEQSVNKTARAPVDSAGDHGRALAELRDEIGDCTRCKLSERRTNIVFGDGNPAARIMFIGEGPGREEDLQGLPFVGDAGTLLTRLIEKMGLSRPDVYIANIVKCRPPMNRDPEDDEVATCRQFVERQIEIIRPEVLVTLGRVALQALMNNPKLKITAARGHFIEYAGIPLMPTFHPAYLLRNPGDKWKTWADAQKVMERLGLK
jgi:DNA polymerase